MSLYLSVPQFSDLQNKEVRIDYIEVLTWQVEFLVVQLSLSLSTTNLHNLQQTYLFSLEVLRLEKNQNWKAKEIKLERKRTHSS